MAKLNYQSKSNLETTKQTEHVCLIYTPATIDKVNMEINIQDSMMAPTDAD